ncbi:FecCD family ABC transporter permease [Aureibacillus halotolerans]|uniref:Iron complex transport system permease protein n=1 Tax=Aureibacillus halotolerans TaxID=1508390 RepID=A0A4R6TV87_9BACI|nr:iron ABC transporter permease [Aureibacillus halotolerans]TDQ36572.1 iron complex transport system permease protein [Aureibacillus halotolerans]
MDHRLPTNQLKWIGLTGLICLFACAFAASLLFGRTPLTLSSALGAFTAYDETSIQHVVIHTERLPRSIIGAVIGASLAVAGGLMQALTRNPLASPSLFGINSGALFFVVVATIFWSITSLTHLMWFAFLGASLAALVVYGLSSLGRDGLTPMKMVLAGAALTALFSSFTQAILVFDEVGMQDVLFWLAGSVSGRPLEMLLPVLPFISVSIIIALLMGKSINLLASGDDVARGLGQNIALVKISMGILIVLLAGSSVAVVGAIGFIGLVIPHIARFFTGNDYRWVLPFSALMGAILLLCSDVVARLIIIPQEVPIGVMTACIGGPFFLYLARKGVTKK